MDRRSGGRRVNAFGHCTMKRAERRQAGGSISVPAPLVTKPHLTLVAPTAENRTVTPLRRPNADYRKREHLTADEVEALVTAAKGNRYGHRDATGRP
jgi:hypothetical protein